MRKPNILWIISDQHNANCFSFSGRNVKTPNLDTLAEKGVVFTHAYCNTPICGPSRISFITGQYPRTHRHLGNFIHIYPERNPYTISSLARKNGYQTAIIGKAHMIKEWNDEGFEYIRYCDLCDADLNDPLSNHYFKYLYENGIADLYDQGVLPDDHPGRKTQAFISKIPHKHSLEVWTSNETIKFLKNRDKERPFFVQMSFERPHAPLAPSLEKANMYKPEDVDLPESIADLFKYRFSSKPSFQREHVEKKGDYPYVPEDEKELKSILAKYYTLITIIDEEIGRVILYLEKEGELKNTVIIYTADHGDFAGEHGLIHKNLGIYESIHRIPLIVYYPGCPSGKKIEEIIESVDLYPFLCELMGIEVPECIEGKSLLPIIERGGEGKEMAICEWAWIHPLSMIYAVRTKDFRLVYYGERKEGELYDHRNDSDELFNLYNRDEYLKVRLTLTEKILDYVKGYEKKSSVEGDFKLIEKYRNCFTLLIHKYKKKWSDIEHLVKRMSG